jgi:hypothetical protein
LVKLHPTNVSEKIEIEIAKKRVDCIRTSVIQNQKHISSPTYHRAVFMLMFIFTT